MYWTMCLVVHVAVSADLTGPVWESLFPGPSTENWECEMEFTYGRNESSSTDPETHRRAWHWLIWPSFMVHFRGTHLSGERGQKIFLCLKVIPGKTSVYSDSLASALDGANVRWNYKAHTERHHCPPWCLVTLFRTDNPPVFFRHPHNHTGEIPAYGSSVTMFGPFETQEVKIKTLSNDQLKIFGKF